MKVYKTFDSDVMNGIYNTIFDFPVVTGEVSYLVTFCLTKTENK